MMVKSKKNANSTTPQIKITNEPTSKVVETTARYKYFESMLSDINNDHDSSSVISSMHSSTTYDSSEVEGKKILSPSQFFFLQGLGSQKKAYEAKKTPPSIKSVVKKIILVQIDGVNQTGIPVQQNIIVNRVDDFTAKPSTRLLLLISFTAS